MLGGRAYIVESATPLAGSCGCLCEVTAAGDCSGACRAPCTYARGHWARTAHGFSFASSYCPAGHRPQPWGPSRPAPDDVSRARRPCRGRRVARDRTDEALAFPRRPGRRPAGQRAGTKRLGYTVPTPRHDATRARPKLPVRRYSGLARPTCAAAPASICLLSLSRTPK